MQSIDVQPVVKWGSEVEKQIKLRMRVSLAAYSYEFLSYSIMDDATYDKLCEDINTSMKTGNPTMDFFFKRVFATHTGMWIHSHPNPCRLKEILLKHYLPEVTI